MKLSLISLALLCTLAPAAQAAQASTSDDNTASPGVGPYARVEIGRTHFSLSNALPQVGVEHRGSAAKFFGGYRFNENLGVEGGYAALGSFSQSVTLGGATVRQDGKARSLYAAATGRLPLGESFALHGRLGVSFGKVSGTSVLPAGNNLLGSTASGLLGVGAEYRPTRNVALTVNYDNYGHLSDKVQASSLVFGVHFWF